MLPPRLKLSFTIKFHYYKYFIDRNSFVYIDRNSFVYHQNFVPASNLYKYQLNSNAHPLLNLKTIFKSLF
jgi:hypothetical protein